VWAIIVSDREFGKVLFMSLAESIRHDISPLNDLSEAQLGELYVWLERAFPRDTDPKHPSGEAHFVGPRESLGEMRDSLVRRLATLGTVNSVQAMRRIIGELPHLPWLTWYLRQAETEMRRRTWAPLTASEILQLTRTPDAQLIQSPEQLSTILMQALKKYEMELHSAQSPIRSLWDKQRDKTFRPIEEDALSDHVKLFLERALVQSGVIVNREVEVSRVAGAPIGQRTDIKIDAIRKTDEGTKLDVITGVIETKGCWNSELLSGIQDQLFKKYLARLGAPVGIYLVGWFDPKRWDKTDKRKAKVPDQLQTRERLKQQAASLPAGFFVEAFILDCPAP
jgi:hypothetical protein